MAIVQPIENLISFEQRNQIGLPNKAGRAVCGWTKCGYENDRAGIYRVVSVKGRQKIQKMVFYRPTNNQLEDQQTWRGIFGDAVDFWHNLTEGGQASYNERAKPRHISGFNLCVREYLCAHRLP